MNLAALLVAAGEGPGVLERALLRARMRGELDDSAIERMCVSLRAGVVEADDDPRLASKAERVCERRRALEGARLQSSEVQAEADALPGLEAERARLTQLRGLVREETVSLRSQLIALEAE